MQMVLQVTLFYLAFTLLAFVGNTYGQTLSEISFSPSTVVDGSNVTIKVELIAPFSPLWNLIWKIKEENVASISVDPGSSLFFINLFNSTYKNRISASVSESMFSELENFTAFLTVRATEADQGSRITATLLTPLDPSADHRNKTGILSVRSDEDLGSCPESFGSNLIVLANSSNPGSSGIFNCTGGGYPFHKNGSALISLHTECTAQLTWTQYSDLQCLRAPQVRIEFFSSHGLALLCVGACSNEKPNCSVAFHIGDEVNVMSSAFYKLPSVNNSWVGHKIWCRELSPYTLRFSGAGRSERLTIQRFQIPSPIRTTCLWYLNRSQVCDVIFAGSPSLEVLQLFKNGTLVNNSNSVVSVNGSTHVYRFYREQVTAEDYGDYDLRVRYKSYPGLNYALGFKIKPRPPPPVSRTCIWFVNDVGSCRVVLPYNVTLLSPTHNDSLLPDGSYTLSSSSFSILVLQASPQEAGIYSVVYRLPSGVDEVTRFKVFVRQYPFNAGLVIGLTLAALVLMIVLMVLCCRNSKKEKQEPERPEIAKQTQKNPSGRTSVANTAF